jgi:hypothetical protein
MLHAGVLFRYKFRVIEASAEFNSLVLTDQCCAAAHALQHSTL